MPRARRVRYQFSFNAGSGTQTTAILYTLETHQAWSGQVTAVRLQFADNQSWTLDSFRLRLYNGNPATAPNLLLYDTGLLEDGVAPPGDLTADVIDLEGNNDAGFWNDSLGASAPNFFVRGNPETAGSAEYLYAVFDYEATGGANADIVTVDIDYLELDAA